MNFHVLLQPLVLIEVIKLDPDYGDTFGIWLELVLWVLL